MRDKDSYYMSLAIEEGKKAYEIGEIPIGALIVKGDQIVAKTHNKKEKFRDATAHAEILAIREAGEKFDTWRLLECDIYVTIEPCPMCAGAIIQSRLRRVIFGPRDEKAWGGLSSVSILQNNNLNHQVEIKEKVKEEECKRLMKKFFKDLRST